MRKQREYDDMAYVMENYKGDSHIEMMKALKQDERQRREAR